MRMGIAEDGKLERCGKLKKINKCTHITQNIKSKLNIKECNIR